MSVPDPSKAAVDRSLWYRLINRRWLRGNPLLHVAVMAERRDWFDWLLWLGADPLVCDDHGMTLLHTAALMHNLERAEPFLSLAIERGVHVNARDDGGHTALHLAVFHDQPAIIAWLLDRGANVNCRTGIGTTPLRHAVRWRRLNAARHLLSAGCYVDERDKHGETPLLEPTVHTPLADLLVEFGADVQACDHGGANLLHLHGARGNVEMVRWALQRGVDSGATNAAGHTPLQALQCEARSVFGDFEGLNDAFADAQSETKIRPGPQVAGRWVHVLALLGDPRFRHVAEA